MSMLTRAQLHALEVASRGCMGYITTDDLRELPWLVERGFARRVDDGRSAFYTITEQGRAALDRPGVPPRPEDAERTRAVVREWTCGAGVGVVVPTVIACLERLMTRHGDRYTIAGACDALDELCRVAAAVKASLRK